MNWSVRQAARILLLICLCRPAASKDLPDYAQLDLSPAPVLAVRWVHLDGRPLLLYLQPPRLSLWPSDRSVTLPKSVAGLADPTPLQLIVKIAPDERIAAVVNRGGFVAALIDLKRMRVLRVLENVRDVGWSRGQLCLVRDADVTRDWLPRAHWTVGQRVVTGPAGFAVTAISEDARVLLARAATGTASSFSFDNGAVLRLSSDTLRVEHVIPLSRQSLHDAWDTVTDGSDFIAWNPHLQSAAIVVGRDDAGGWLSASLYVVSERAILPELQKLGGRSITSVVAPPIWVGDQLLASIENQADASENNGGWNHPHRGVWMEQKLMLIDPLSGRAQSLIETMIWPALGHIDPMANRIAYATRSPWVYHVAERGVNPWAPKQWTVTVEEYQPSPAGNRRSDRAGQPRGARLVRRGRP